MRKQFITILSILIGLVSFAQSGHVMQGIGAVNMSMGGAATAQPLDINGAIQWNPATLSSFEGKTLSLSVGAFFSSPELSSSFGPLEGTTIDEHSTSIMPALAYVWSKPNSKHTFGVSAFGVSGFGVDFPADMNYPQDMMGNPNMNYDPSLGNNPISFPQYAGGFGNIKSDYMLLQVSLSYAYELSDKVSIGLQPNFNYETLELAPNPTAAPDMTGRGYPVTDAASAMGYGAQIGIFYDSHDMLKLGMSYKTKQYFSEYTFENTYLDGSAAPDTNFTMNYPSILSFGMGLSGKKLDFAADVRFVGYENTEGFKESGWQINDDSTSPYYGYPTGAVNGFGWRNMTIFSAGLQYKIMDNLPIRIGYTSNTNPIKDELAFYSVSAPAVVTQAAQIGLGYTIGKLQIDALYHKGFRGDGNTGSMLSPMAYDPVNNPLGAVPGTSVSYDMETSMVQLTLSYKL
jgi:long-chain fatty acid transport protein